MLAPLVLSIARRGTPTLALIAALSLSACTWRQDQDLTEPTILARLDGRLAIMDDGYRLPYRVWEPKVPAKGSILALHGFNDYSRSFAGLAEFLAQHAYRTHAYDQRGFGNTASRGRWAGSQRLAADARSMMTLIKSQAPQLPLYILGESMGGAVAILAAAGHSASPADGLVLAAPAVWSDKDQNPFLRGLFWTTATLSPAYKMTGEHIHILPSDNFKMLRALGKDPLVIKATRIDALYGAARLMDAAAAAPEQLSVPMLILYGRYDRIVPKLAICRFVEALANSPNSNWKLRVYPKGFHLLTRDLHADEVLNDIATWLQAPGKLRPGAYGPQRSWLSICSA